MTCLSNVLLDIVTAILVPMSSSVWWFLLQVEAEARAASERDFLEMSTAGKTRVLYLEQWKAGASARLLRLQERLDVSVPEQVNIF